MGLLAFLILLPLVVFVHELGHFALARLNGVRVDAFSIGFGPALFRWRDRHGTEWRISAIPLGGYVKMFGQSDVPEKSGDKIAAMERLSKSERARHFEFKSRLGRASIIAAGPLFNYAFGLLLFFVLFLSVGLPNAPAVVESVADGSPAGEAGLLPGDVLLEIGGRKIARPRDVNRLVAASGGRPVGMLARRGDVEKSFEVAPKSEGGRWLLGITYSARFEDYRPVGFVGAAGYAGLEVANITADTSRALWEMVSGKRSSKELGGMISIAKVSGAALESGLYSFLYMVALMSVSLGLFNLFPIPMLDGGYLVIYALEGLIRRDFSEKFKERLFLAGFVFVVCLMLVSNLNDLARLAGL